MDWVEEALAREKARIEREKVVQSSDAGYFGGFVSSTISSVGEMFGMEPFESAENFRAQNPGSGLVSELAGALVPYVGWEATLARAPRIATALGGAAGRLGLEAAANPISYGAANLAIRYAPVELARLGTGMFVTEDWNKYGNLMADVGLSTMLAGGFGGLGGFLRSAGKSVNRISGRVAEAPVGLAAPFELRIARSGNATPVNPKETIEDVIQNRLFESLTERPVGIKGANRRQAAVHALEGGNEPKDVAGINFLFRESNNAKGLVRQKLMQDSGVLTLGDEGTAGLLKALGKKDIAEVAEAGRFATRVAVGSDRAAGTLKKAVGGLSPVGDGAFIGREAGNGLFIVGVRTKLGEQSAKTIQARAEVQRQIIQLEQMIADPAKSKGKLTSMKAAHRKLMTQLKRLGPPDPISNGDEWFFIKTDKPDLFIKRASKANKITFNQFAKYRDSFRPEVNQGTIFNEVQNRVIATFTPQNIDDIRAGRVKKARADWMSRMTGKTAESFGLKNSEMLETLWEGAYHSIAVSMAKGVRNGLYDRLFMMLGLNKTTGESMVNRLIGGEVKMTRRARFGIKQTHAPEVAPGVQTMRQLLAENSERLTPADYRLIYDVGNAQAPKELLAELTASGEISSAARTVLDGIEKLDKWFWEQMMPVAESLGLDAKFSLLEGPYIPKLMKGDNYVVVTDPSTKAVKYLASGTRKQAQKEANAFVEAAKEMGYTFEAQAPHTWYEEGDELVRLHQELNKGVLADAQVSEIARKALRKLAIESAGLRTGMVKGSLPKSLTEARSGIAASTGTEFTAKSLIQDMQQHYNMIARYLGYESWQQRWKPEVMKLRKIDPRMNKDLGHRAQQMLGYSSAQGKYLDKTLDNFFRGAIGGKAATKIAREANSLMYDWNIGLFNPTFAIVNLLTPLQTVAPWLAMMKVAPEAADDLMHTAFRFGADGKPRGIFNTLDIPKLMGKALKEIGRPDDVLLEALGRAKTEGYLSPQLFENFAGHGSSGSVTIREAFDRAGGGVAGSWEAMKTTARWASTHSEEWSRAYAFTAAHVYGRDVAGLTGEALYRFAVRGTHVTMYGYHAMDRSLMFTGPIGSMFGLFKNWQMHFISSMFQYAGLGWREGIWSPLIWQFTGSLAVGGIGATPLVLAADQITDWMDNQPNSYLWMKENWHDSADEIYYGLPALFGISLQASSALPGTDVRNDLTMLSNFVFLERAKAAFKATKGAWDYAEQNGENPLANPNVRDALLQGYAPRALWRLFSTTEGNAIKSMSSGYPQVRGVSKMGQLAYSLGFNPVEVESQQDVARYLWREQTAQREAIAQLGTRFADAQMNGDVDEMMRTINLAVAQGVPVTSVAKSAQTRVRREQQQDIMSKYGFEGQLAKLSLEE